MPSPLVSATLKSAFLSLCSALVATFLTPKDPPILALVIYSALATPPNFLWQQFLERTFPGYITEKKEADGDVKGGTPAGGGVTLKRRLNVQNTVMKVIIDQTLGSVVNVALHLGGVRALQGVPLPECWQAVTEVSSDPCSQRPLYRAGDSQGRVREKREGDVLIRFLYSKHGHS